MWLYVQHAVEYDLDNVKKAQQIPNTILAFNLLCNKTCQ